MGDDGDGGPAPLQHSSREGAARSEGHHPEPQRGKAVSLGISSTTRDNPNLWQILFMATIFFLISFWLHFPGLTPNNYTDLMDTLWPRIHQASGIIPYRDYNLEYPAISALVLYVSSLWRDEYGFYFTMSAILLLCMLIAVLFVYKILTMRGLSVQRLTYFVIFTPSFIYFSVYSFDWIGASLMVASIYFALARRVKLSGVSMGLAIAARIIPIVCLPFLLYEFKKTRNRRIFLVSTASAWLAANLYFIFTNLQGFLYPYVFQAGFYAEDSWLNILPSQLAKPLSVILLCSLLGLIIFWRKRFSLVQQSLLAVLAFVIVSFKFPPQYMILLLPLFALNAVAYGEFMIANILDVMLILWYFSPIFSLGDSVSPSSPVQWIAIARQFILAIVFVRVFLSSRNTVVPVEREIQREPKISHGTRVREARVLLPLRPNLLLSSAQEAEPRKPLFPATTLRKRWLR
jgi:hypothetical protein